LLKKWYIIKTIKIKMSDEELRDQIN